MSSIQKKYQVFVSSTFKDLQEERQEVIKALLELDFNIRLPNATGVGAV